RGRRLERDDRAADREPDAGLPARARRGALVHRRARRDGRACAQLSPPAARRPGPGMTGAPNPEPKRRRLVLASAASLATSVVPGCARAPALATANGGPFAYPFTDYWTRDAIDARARRMRLYGTKQALDEDVA